MVRQLTAVGVAWPQEREEGGVARVRGMVVGGSVVDGRFPSRDDLNVVDSEIRRCVTL